MNRFAVPTFLVGFVLAAACSTDDSQTHPATPTPTDTATPSTSAVKEEPEETEVPIDRPNPERMVLTLEDLPDGAEIYSEGPTEAISGAEDYLRVFGPGIGQVGGSEVLSLMSQAWLFDQAMEAGFAFALERRLARSENARPTFVSYLTEALGAEATVVSVMALEGGGVGDESTATRVVVDTDNGHLDVTMYYARVGRVFEVVAAIGRVADVRQEDVGALAEVMARRTAAELAAYE